MKLSDVQKFKYNFWMYLPVRIQFIFIILKPV